MNLRLQVMFRALTATAVAVVLIADAEAQAEGEANALWNDSGKMRERGLWVYPTTGSCPEIRRRAPPLVFCLDADPGRPEYRRRDLSCCFAYQRDFPLKMGPSCRDGVLKVQRVPSSNKLTGTYEFTMEDESVRSGNFVAAYCPKTPWWKFWEWAP